MITTLAIQLEAWVQEEIAAQSKLAHTLAALDVAVRGGDAAALARSGTELEAELAMVPAREARRRALLGRLGTALGVAPKQLTLTRLAARLEEERHDTARLTGLRNELRTVVAGVVRTARRLAAVAHYHQGLLDELCATLAGNTVGAESGRLVDARG